MCYQVVSDYGAFMLCVVITFNFSIEMDLLSNLFAALNLDGEGYEEHTAQRRLVYEEVDMDRDETSSLGCYTLSNSNDESLEVRLLEEEEEGKEEEAPLTKRRRAMNMRVMNT